MKLTFTRSGFVFAAGISWLVFMLLSALQFNLFQLLTIFGFLLLVLLPGLLTLIILRIKELPFWAYVSLAISFSLLELMLIALAGNTLLPHMGVARPLDPLPIVTEISCMVFALLLAAYVRLDREQYIFSFKFFDSWRDTLLALTPALFVVMSVFGAIRLNNGASGSLTLVMLICIAVYMAVLVYFAEEVGENVIPTAFFFMSLALLFMTSLRGWYITGHDIQKEYHVFELAKSNGQWVMAYYHDAYNACVSITVLPTIFSNLLRFPDPYAYKIFFQILFALVPPVLFLTIRRYTSVTIALLSTFYFLAFPTFFGDMPFLNRQEIAFLFFVVMVYVIFHESFSLRLRHTLFLTFGLGLVLSHYSTTYTVVGVLLFALCMQPIVAFLGPYLRKLRWFSNSSVPALSEKSFVYRPLITWWVVSSLVLGTFVWTNIVTDTASSSIGAVVQSTFAAMLSNAKEDSQSSDVNASLLSYSRVDYDALFKIYETKVIGPTRAKAPPDTYFDTSTYSQYQIHVAPDETVPLTIFGRILTWAHVDVANANYLFHQASAKVLQILIGLGFMFVVFSSLFTKKKINTEFMLLSAGSIILLAAIVILPILSAQYGLLRAFQQSLIFLGLFVVIGSLVLTLKFSNKTRVILAAAFVLVFFLSETGAITQVFGGYNPVLNLNNDGLYYDVYYPHKTEQTAIGWLDQNTTNYQEGVQVTTQSDFYTVQKVRSITTLDPVNDIYPGLIRKDSFVFLGYTTVHKGRATITYNGTQITYTYPVEFLDNNKDLVYSNDDVKIYK